MADYGQEDSLIQQAERQQILEVVKVFDKKSENQVNAADLPTIFQALGCNITQAETREFLQYLDPNGEGIVRIPELEVVISNRLQTRETAEMLTKAFRVFDKENRGALHPNELRHILSTFGEVMEADEIEGYIQEADAKCPDLNPTGEKTGLINYTKFVNIMLDLQGSDAPPGTS